MQTLEQYIDEKLNPIIQQAIERHEKTRVLLLHLKGKKSKFPELPYECTPEYRNWFTNKYRSTWQQMQPKKSARSRTLKQAADITMIISMFGGK